MTHPETEAGWDPSALKQAGPIDAMIGARIRAHRQARGLSGRALGRKLGLTAQQITKYETGLNRIPAATLYTVAVLLDVPIARLLPMERATSDPKHACIQAIVVELSQIEDRRFLAALQALVAAARDVRAYRAV